MYQNSKRKKSNYRGNNRNNKSNQYILPPISVIEEYEAKIPGSAEKIMDLVDIEQDHRHKWENRALTSYIISYRFGQLLSFFSLIAIIYGAYMSASKLNNVDLAYFILLLGFTFHFFISLVSIKRKKFFSRPRTNKYRK